MWDQVEKTEETFGSGTEAKTRIKKTSFDTAGRPTVSEETSSIDTPFPEIVDAYNKETGALETQHLKTEGKTKTITSKYNTLGQLIKYTDSDENSTTYEYEPEGDYRLEQINDGKGTQTYSYDTTSGFLTKLVDSAAGVVFTSSYDVEGKMLAETYPNGMVANYTLNALGETTALTYEKNTHCAIKCPEVWFNDATIPTIHGEILSQTSTLAKERYTYDSASRLIQTQEEPVGKGCTTRIYAYEEESNRTSLVTREPGNEGKCALEGGAVERHTYDTANRLTDSGIVYEPFGNITTLPPTDTGGQELTTSYYVDGQVASQTQNEETINYNYDPAGRARETISTGINKSTMISHYSGSGEALTWTSEEEGKKWSRNIPGIDGELDAIQSSSGITVLQLHDLKGDIVGKASLSEVETKLQSTYNSTEFGVPTTSNPPKYSWLGADGVSSEQPSSGTITQDGTTYVPQTGLPLQTQSVTPPIPINAGAPFVSAIEPWVAEAAAGAAARQVLAAEEARRALDGASCDEEIEGCGPDPEHGENISRCSVWASWSYGLYGPPAVYGHFKCGGYAQNFELQVAVQLVLWGGVTGGNYRQIAFGKQSWHGNVHGEHSFVVDFGCTTHKWYRAWVWGRSYFEGQTYWEASALDGRLWQCPEPPGAAGNGVEEGVESDPGGPDPGE